MSNLKAESYTAEAYEYLQTEFYKVSDRLEKAEIERAIAQAEKADLHDELIEAKAIKRTLYVVFGREF